MNPLFSIITVCYNSEKTVEKTLQSVLAQTEGDYEYLVIDGASTDRTLEIVRAWEPKFAGRMRIVSEPDQGIYDAMNKGIRMARGRFVGLLNSDDHYEQDALARVKEADDGSEFLIIYGMQRNLRDGREVGVFLKRHEFIEEDMITHAACFVSRSVYERFGVYSLDYKSSADYEFMLRIRKEADIRFRPVYHILTNFTEGGMSGTVRGYMETMRLKHSYGLIGGARYVLLMIKCRLALLLGRNRKGSRS